MDKGNYQEVADISLDNRKKYCDKQGYKHHIHCGPYQNLGNLYYAIQRIHILYDLMFPDGEPTEDKNKLFWVLNISSMVMNHTKRLEDFVINDPEKDFFIHKDVNGLNAGSFIIRRTEWARQWLSLIKREAPTINHCWYEQRVMQIHADEPVWKKNIKIMDHPGINDYFYDLYKFPPTTPGDYKPGNFCLSLPGTSLDERIQLLKSDRVLTNIIY